MASNNKTSAPDTEDNSPCEMVRLYLCYRLLKNISFEDQQIKISMCWLHSNCERITVLPYHVIVARYP